MLLKSIILLKFIFRKHAGYKEASAEKVMNVFINVSQFIMFFMNIKGKVSFVALFS